MQGNRDSIVLTEAGAEAPELLKQQQQQHYAESLLCIFVRNKLPEINLLELEPLQRPGV